VADRFGLGTPAEPIAATNLDRLAGDRHDPIHQVWVHLGPHPGMHAAHRAADDQPQMAHTKTFSNEPISGLDHVMVAVMREVSF